MPTMQNIGTLLILLLTRSLGVEAHPHEDGYPVHQQGFHGREIRESVIIEEPFVPEYQIVENQPPTAEEELVTLSPGENFVWVKGFWRWNGSEWVAEKGHWAERPSVDAIWVNGGWVQEQSHWHWKRGYWR